ncbi:ABC-F family ATP-binding cassette domain-containing protein [Mucilaginibacter ginsenosidivorax]|uniref:ABC-F family ATP-binding cassette domain-containing protein n=1 Tax=Mucilaginibacter ginsenosidivorax TaxID=862126 RepID=A0A5B8VXZ9_9SPHI|nr:ABC-F family ATP-binding cassette domain-containing protein [Mucilaginibacter ginsenosidivorax]QEC75168.1 ABC-F family ATP-binding cassette domain-containing protein [Mucilaginibacter ginsenosidivorax]
MSILIRSLAYIHPDRETLFENINLAIAKGEKAALVGFNGTGKSTLLQLLAGRLQATGGTVTLSEPFWYVPQQVGNTNQTIAEALQVGKKLTAFRAILNGDVHPNHFVELHDDWEIEEKIKASLAHWQLQYLEPQQTMSMLSGGEKAKVMLAGITLHQPGIILLDEPSNHLDTQSREQLYRLIETSKATILAVSHDRTLLNLLPLTIELSAVGLERFGGNYDFYESQKQQDIDALQARVHEQTKILKQAKAKVRELTEQRQQQEARGKAQGNSGSLPRILAGRRKAQAQQSSARISGVQDEKISQIAAKLSEQRASLQTYQPPVIMLKSSGLHAGKVLIDAREISFGYGEISLWQPLTFQVRSGYRVQVTGANGSGKTTLLSILMGQLQPTTGYISCAAFSYAYLDQEYTLIDEKLGIFEQAQQCNSRLLPEHELRSLLVYAQFPAETWNLRCATLSGGEKLKLALCCLSLRHVAPDILILDEPTNNLDLQSMEMLIRTVRDFGGTLILITHDAWFAEQTGINSIIRLT